MGNFVTISNWLSMLGRIDLTEIGYTKYGSLEQYGTSSKNEKEKMMILSTQAIRGPKNSQSKINSIQIKSKVQKNIKTFFCKMLFGQSFGCCNAIKNKASKKALKFWIVQSKLIHRNTDNQKGREKWEREGARQKGS